MPSAVFPRVVLLLWAPNCLEDPGHPLCHLDPNLLQSPSPSALWPRLRWARALWAGPTQGAAPGLAASEQPGATQWSTRRAVREGVTEKSNVWNSSRQAATLRLLESLLYQPAGCAPHRPFGVTGPPEDGRAAAKQEPSCLSSDRLPSKWDAIPSTPEPWRCRGFHQLWRESLELGSFRLGLPSTKVQPLAQVH